ncbi:MAG: transketolase C-terminal domain-containing protein [Candidatus Thermoplasmatota archaeon]|nr:transketolase C-terminal domain-containing protein [Candidatus Thermoplasmatota archaeon]MEE3269708.1 transketolase C-terminal domain-containing protein [Candidatus Thermoplasmatota archaeon]
MRHGVWGCPECGRHQVWRAKTGTERLDRGCEHCGKRVRAKLDRSSTGQGRKRNVRIWERETSVSKGELEQEVRRRDAAADESADSSSEMVADVSSQTTLPNIWGAGWEPGAALEFSSPLDSEAARIEFLRFFAERHDGHIELVSDAWKECNPPSSFDGESFHSFSSGLLSAIRESLHDRLMDPSLSPVHSGEVMPMRAGGLHLERRTARLLIDSALCLRRIAYHASITIDMRLEWQRMMTRTRAVDEHLKELFSEGIETPDGGRFGGKGFRSTWQEGVVACASALRRAVDLGDDVQSADVVAPMIRDVGLALAMGQTPTEVFAAQMGKSGSYMNGGHEASGGRDLHIGNWEKRVLPPTAPLPIASATTTGIALAASRLGIDRFHLAPVGEGCSSSGEFWEAMNLAGTRGLPMAFMIQNNQIALDTYIVGQSGAETYGDKGHAMGVPSWTIDGSDPSLFYASTAVAREFAADGGGSTLIHVETMRGCGHAHHHDDLYLGASSGNPPGYVDRGLLGYWADKDPLPNHRELLLRMGCDESVLEQMESEEQGLTDTARKEMEDMPWPEGHSVTKGVTSLHDAGSHSEQFSRFDGERDASDAPLEPGEVSLIFSDAANSSSYSRAIQNAMVSIADESGGGVVFMGEDMEVAGAFGMNLPLKAKGHSDKLLDMPLSEAVIIHSATGAALGGMRPMAEIQFGGFAALAMNALINNAAQLRWRWGADVPLTVRIPLGGKTRSGPYHANMIESWFLNDPGLVMVFPSTPQDAYDLLVESHALDDPVIYLEHIGLYGLRGGLTGWGDSISQVVDRESVHERLAIGESSIGTAKIVRGGKDLTIVTWGAMVHVAMKAASEVSKKGIEAEVVDLRTISPFDAQTCVDSVLRTGRLLILQEAQWTGGLGNTVSSRILEEAFWCLEVSPVVVGALDTPVPFSPTLEDHTMPSAELVIRHIERMCL